MKRDELDVRRHRARCSSAAWKQVPRLAKELKLPGERLIFVPNQNLAALGKRVRAAREIYARARE